MFVFGCKEDNFIKMMHNMIVVFCKFLLEKFSGFSYFVLFFYQENTFMIINTDCELVTSQRFRKQ